VTILVTGATGTIGRHLIDQLVRRGLPVRALTRDPARAALPAGVEVAAGDLTAPDSLTQALAGVDRVHLISIGGDDYAPLHTATKVLARVRAAGVRRVTVLTGTAGELAVADAVAASGLEWTHVRPVEFMANKLQWAEPLRARGVVWAPFATQPHAIVHEADVAAVIATALTEDGHTGQTYTPTGPEALTPLEAARRIGEVVGTQVRLEELTAEQLREQMRAAGFREEVIDEVIAYGGNPPEVAFTVSGVVKEVTGQPPRTFTEWVAEHAAAFRPADAQDQA
jgi:uncharacterized protein YbjT (DUF2867 family)